MLLQASRNKKRVLTQLEGKRYLVTTTFFDKITYFDRLLYLIEITCTAESVPICPQARQQWHYVIALAEKLPPGLECSIGNSIHLQYGYFFLKGGMHRTKRRESTPKTTPMAKGMR